MNMRRCVCFLYCKSQAIAQVFFRTQPLSIVCPRIRVLRRESIGQVGMPFLPDEKTPYGYSATYSWHNMLALYHDCRWRSAVSAAWANLKLRLNMHIAIVSTIIRFCGYTPPHIKISLRMLLPLLTCLI